MVIKAVLFDFDGVVLNSGPLAFRILKRIGEEKGLCLDKEVRKVLWGQGGPTRKILKLLFTPNLVTGRNLKKLQQSWRSQEAKEAEKRAPFIKGFPEVLIELKKEGKITGLVTNRRTDTVLAYLGRLDIPILDYFDLIQTWGTCKEVVMRYLRRHHLDGIHLVSAFPKPNPKVFNVTLEYLRKKGVKKEEILYLGDSMADLIPARAKGITFLGKVTKDYWEREDWLEHGGLDGRFVIDELTDLPRWLEDFES